MAFALQWDGDFGERVRLTGYVVGVEGDVGSVVHFACGRDVPHHSGPYLEAMALAVNTAAANASQHEFRMFRVAEIQVDLDAAERGRNLVNDPRHEFFNVEGGGNPLREFLQAHEFREP